MAAIQAPDLSTSPGSQASQVPADPIGKKGSSLQALRLWAIVKLLRPSVLTPVFGLLRRFVPLLTLGNKIVVARYLDVLDVLGRDEDFHASPLYGPRIDRLDGPFILGLDRGPQYDRELGILREVVVAGDLARIGHIVAAEAALRIGAAQNGHTMPAPHRIDVVSYARASAMRVVAEYFGIRGSSESLAGWLHDVFYDIFSNYTGDPSVHGRAVASSAALGGHIDREIAFRKAGGASAWRDDVLGRLLALQGADRPWLDDATIRRNMTGMIVGTVDNTCGMLALAIAQLLRRPNVVRYARAAAEAGDVATVRRYIYEAARFDPPMPLLVRYARHATVVAAGTPRAHSVPAGTALFLGMVSALHDADGFDEPTEFNIEHDAGQLLFGFAFHQCLGNRINGVQIPELTAALLRLPGLRPASGSAGRVQFDGPFPSRLVLEWT